MLRAPLRRSLLAMMLVARAAAGANAQSTPESAANDAPADPPPNVLLIMADDLTACLGCYGNTVCRTPNLDRLAAEGGRFDRAYCQYPVCGPSRASLMSGLYPSATRMLGNDALHQGAFKRSNPALADHPSIGEFLRQNGYFSARVSKIYHMGVPGGIEEGVPGGDEPRSWDWTYNVIGPETYSQGELELLTPTRTHYGSNFARLMVDDELAGTQADVLSAAQGVAVLESRSRRPKPQPFFLAVGFVRPHVPLVAPKRLFDLYPSDAIELPFVPPRDLDDVPLPARGMANVGRYGMNETQKRQAVAGYYAAVSFMDEQVGKLLAALDRLDLRQRTIVIFTSDHGYSLGEHDCWQKLSLFEESTRVPLLISAPGHERGATFAPPVELVDLYPTIAELCGLADRAPKNLQGVSLAAALRDAANGRREKAFAYTVSYQKGESIRTARHRYNRWGASPGEGNEELYDHATDPKEFTNLASLPEHAATLSNMRRLMDEARAAANQRSSL